MAKKKPPVFRGGNANWWKNLILGNAGPRGNPLSTPPPAAQWGAYTAGLKTIPGMIKDWASKFNAQQFSAGGGGSPYAGILGDYLGQARADAAAESAAQKGDMIGAIRNYIISYGALPDFSSIGGLSKDAQGYFNQALDEKTRGLAAKAEAEGVSSHARLARQNEQATRFIPASLASRGILRSGQTGVDLANQAQDYKTQGYDMLQSMLGGITGSVSSYQEAERMRQRQLADMEMQIAMQQAQDWGDSYMADSYDYGYDMPQAPVAPGRPAAPRPKPRPRPRPRPGPRGRGPQGYYGRGGGVQRRK